MKKYLFTTVDNFEIYEGDEIIPLCIKKIYGFIPYILTPQVWRATTYIDHEHFIYFKEKNNAKQLQKIIKKIIRG